MADVAMAIEGMPLADRVAAAQADCCVFSSVVVVVVLCLSSFKLDQQYLSECIYWISQNCNFCMLINKSSSPNCPNVKARA
jgi:hypothetical protein